VYSERKRLPGKVRQRIKHFLTDLAEKPRPAGSEALDLPDTVANSIKVEWEVTTTKTLPLYSHICGSNSQSYHFFTFYLIFMIPADCSDVIWPAPPHPQGMI
jgi:hypothetical protein